MSNRLRSGLVQLSRGAGQAAVDLIFPAVCRLCDAPVVREADFCQRCETSLTASEPMMAAACQRCGRPGQSTNLDVPDDIRESQPYGQPVSAHSQDSCCQRCKDSSFRFDRVVPLWAYLDRVRDAIVAAKYAHHAPLADALGRRLAVRLNSACDRDWPAAVTFVPSHFTRQFSRGGNSNLIIATAVATGIGQPCYPMLRITRRIEKQAWLEEADRASNVRGAFARKKSYAFPNTPGLR